VKATTIDLLASKIGILKRTIYEVFRDKDEHIKKQQCNKRFVNKLPEWYFYDEGS